MKKSLKENYLANYLRLYCYVRIISLCTVISGNLSRKEYFCHTLESSWPDSQQRTCRILNGPLEKVSKEEEEGRKEGRKEGGTLKLPAAQKQ
jgi:hypothetical protein